MSIENEVRVDKAPIGQVSGSDRWNSCKLAQPCQVLPETNRSAINIVDLDGVVLFCNDEMKRLAGRDITSEHCWDVPGTDGPKCEGCPLKVGIGIGETKTVEMAGEISGRAFRITHTGLMFGGTKAILQVYDDVTERRKSHWKVAQAQKLESIGILVSGIAHDFNNLLGIIVGNASMIERSAGDGERVAIRSRLISEAAERGASLVKQLLMFARNSEPAFTDTSINRIIKDISKLFDETFPKSMHLLCNLSEDIPVIEGDPVQIHQVVLNLILNAKDAMNSSGDIILSTEVAPEATIARLFPAAPPGDYVLVGVSDNGCGMSEEILDHIFEPFFTTKEDGRGTGLGLAVVSGIVESHRGFINVRSEPGKGTTFSIYFPAYHGRAVSGQPEGISDDDIRGGDETILIAEDEEMLNDLLATMLMSKGYRVIRTWNGREAVEAYMKSHQNIALVISDMGLPKLTGSEVLTWLKEINPRVKFILATGYIEPNERASVLENGASDVILKPYKVSDIHMKVREVLDA